MEWIEVDPLPAECLNCLEEECYNCDYAGKRRVLLQEDELTIRRKTLAIAMKRLQKQIDEINRSLSSPGDQQKTEYNKQEAENLFSAPKCCNCRKSLI